MSAAPQRHELLRFLAGHLVVGLAAGWTLLALLLWTDVGGLATLLWESPDWPLLLAMLAFGFAITFGSLAMGTGVMSLGHRRRQGHDDWKGGRTVRARPAPVGAARRRR